MTGRLDAGRHHRRPAGEAGVRRSGSARQTVPDHRWHVPRPVDRDRRSGWTHSERRPRERSPSADLLAVWPEDAGSYGARSENLRPPGILHHSRRGANTKGRPGATAVRRSIDGRVAHTQPAAAASAYRDGLAIRRRFASPRLFGTVRRHLVFDRTAAARVRNTNRVGSRFVPRAETCSPASCMVSAGGTAAGLVLVWPVGIARRSFLYGVGGADPVALAGAALVLAAVGLFAGWGPGRKAARLDPATFLRAD